MEITEEDFNRCNQQLIELKESLYNAQEREKKYVKGKSHTHTRKNTYTMFVDL